MKWWWFMLICGFLGLLVMLLGSYTDPVGDLITAACRHSWTPMQGQVIECGESY